MLKILASIGASLLTCAVLLNIGQSQEPSPVTKQAEVEGVAEYRLANGCRVLVYPDASSQVLTVNMTVLVGSRHEGYGESGMAHLLEHMLFKGTLRHPDIDQELKKLGATDMNGTTWYDRTNFYETLPASSENLDWAVEMEADRLFNCAIRGEDLAAEMTVVRSEFEMNENAPDRILMQRMTANAFEWHNYGKTVIGSRIDIERVPLPRLRAFYKKYYRPDNVVIIVTGKVDEQAALASVAKHFGPLQNPEGTLEETYTAEPVQDGERVVYLRRVGGAPTTGAVYHIPPVAHADFAPVKVLSQILGTEPNGILYRELVKTSEASSVTTEAFECREPGTLMLMATPKEADIDEVKIEMFSKRLVEVAESTAKNPVSDEILAQAKAELQKNFEDALLDSKELAMSLSDWSACGDWRLLFLTRDRIEQVTAADIQRVADMYLRKSNRTVGIYLPTESPARSNVPPTPDIEKVVANYKSSRAKINVEQAFEPTPLEIQKHLIQQELDSGLKFSLLPKSTRGERFYLQLNLNFGGPENFVSRESINACKLVGPAMLLGTTKFSRAQIDDLKTKLKAQIDISSQPGTLKVAIDGRKQFFVETMELLYQILRQPTFDEVELGLLKSAQLTELTQAEKSPEMIAQIAASRAINPVAKTSHQYVPTISEMLDELRAAKVEHIKDVYDLISGAHGTATLVGAFDEDGALRSLKSLLADWKSKSKFVRLENIPSAIKPDTIELKTPDQASAMFIRGANLKSNIKDADWEALAIAADILGGASLDSRLAAHVREEKGLSYQVGCSFKAGEHDQAAVFITYATTNPKNKDALTAAINETFAQVRNKGFTQAEVDAAKTTYIKSVESALADDGPLCELVNRYKDRGVDLEFLAARLERIKSLKLEQVNAAAKKLLSAEAITVLAGDFVESSR